MVSPSAPPLPSNLFIVALARSLAAFYAHPEKAFYRAKRLEQAWQMDRRVVGRAWTMLRPLGVIEPRTSGANGHGGTTWEVNHAEAMVHALLNEALPYHLDALVYQSLGYHGSPKEAGA